MIKKFEFRFFSNKTRCMYQSEKRKFMNKFKSHSLLLPWFLCGKIAKIFRRHKINRNRINGTHCIKWISIVLQQAAGLNEWNQRISQSNQATKVRSSIKSGNIENRQRTHKDTHNSAVTFKIYWNVNGTNGKNKYERLHENSPDNNSI